MAYASLSGRARTSARKPQAHAICDRCGARYNFVDLQWQNEWRGPIIQNIRVLVCKTCLDIPQEQLRAIVLPTDPEPIINARTQDFVTAETNYRTISAPTVIDPETGLPIPGTTLRVTEDCQNRTIDPFGEPVGLTQPAVMPYNGAVQKAYGAPLNLLSVTSDGSATVTVTCAAVHNLVTGNQVSVAGCDESSADGFFSITVLTATAFQYMTYGSIDADSLLTPTTRIVPVLVGVPLGY